MKAELTLRELNTATLIAQGKSRKAVARELNCPLNTVGDRLRSVYFKLNVHNRVELTLGLAMQPALAQARQPLTNEQVKAIWLQSESKHYRCQGAWWEQFARAIEAAHGIGETSTDKK